MRDRLLCGGWGDRSEPHRKEKFLLFEGGYPAFPCSFVLFLHSLMSSAIGAEDLGSGGEDGEVDLF